MLSGTKSPRRKDERNRDAVFWEVNTKLEYHEARKKLSRRRIKLWRKSIKLLTNLDSNCSFAEVTLLGQTLRNFGVSVGRRIRPVIRPVLAKLYRSNPARVSGLMLYALGIADPSYRKNFSTLARIVDTLPKFDGCIIECGVYRGATLLGMAHRLALRGVRDVKLIGCDSFEGFPEPSKEDALSDGTFHETALKGVFRDTSYEGLMFRIAEMGYAARVQLLKGFFENTLPQLSNHRFSIAHIDCDLYQSYVTCLEALYPRMVKGGYMIFDEYDFSRAAYPGAQKAIDAFFADKPEKLKWFEDLEDRRCFVVKE